MKQKIVFKVTLNGQKSRSKALKVSVGLSGVESAALGGQDKSQIEVIVDGVDAVELIQLLRKNVGYAEIVSVSPVGEKKEYKLIFSPFPYTNGMIDVLHPQSQKRQLDEIQQIRALKSQPLEGSSELIEINKNQINYDVVGSNKKQPVYDLRSMEQSIYNNGSSSAPIASPSVDPTIIEQQLQNIRDQMSSFEEARIREIQRLQEEIVARDRRHQQEIETLSQRYQDEMVSLRQQLQAQQELIQQLWTQFLQSLVFQQ